MRHAIQTSLLVITVTVSFGCAQATPEITEPLREKPFLYRVERSGIKFETETSRPVSFSVKAGAKIALLHDDRDETDRYIRAVLEQAIFGIKSTHPHIVIVERRGIRELLAELKFQSEGLVRDQDIARIGHFLGLDDVVVFDTIHGDLDDLYGLNNQIDTWEVLVPVKIIDVTTAEVKCNCTSITRAVVGRKMKASEVHALNKQALALAVGSVTQCLSVSIGGTASLR